MAALALPLLLLLPQEPQNLSVDQILSRVREAVGYERLMSNRQGLMITGKSTLWGESGNFTLLFSPEGEYVRTVVSAIGQTTAFDGRHGWEADYSGATRRYEESETLVDRSVMSFYTHDWLRPVGPWKLSKGIAAREGQLNLELQAPDEIFKGTIAIDARTWLPQSLTFTRPEGTQIITVSGYKDALGGKLFAGAEHTLGEFKDTYTVNKIEPAPIFVRNPYEMLPWQPRDTTWSSESNRAIEVKRARSGHILVHPTVNGKDVGWFILDSGAGAMCIDKSTADKLELASVGIIPTVGVGGVVEGHFRKAEKFSLGGATVSNLYFIELELAAIGKALGVELAGIVGYDYLRRAVVELDLKDLRVGVHSPKSYKLTNGSWQELVLGNRHPIVKAKFSPKHEGLFRLDTGANGYVTFHGPTVKKLNLLEGLETQPAMLGGVGGMIEAKSGKIDWFELAGHRFEKPMVTFMTQMDGVLADNTLAGNLGQEFLVPFTLVFDYPNSRIAFVKHENATKGEAAFVNKDEVVGLRYLAPTPIR